MDSKEEGTDELPVRCGIFARPFQRNWKRPFGDVEIGRAERNKSFVSRSMRSTVGSLTFDSTFDSGNLAWVERARSKENEFHIYIASDCAGTPFEVSAWRTWFYFTVTGGVVNTSSTFVVVNALLSEPTVRNGLKIVGRSTPSRPQWARVDDFLVAKSSTGFTMRWTHTWNVDGEVASFAFTFPYPLEAIQTKLAEISLRFCGDETSGVYYYRETLTRSLEGRDIDMLTITSHKGHTEEREMRIEGLFPSPSERPYCFLTKKIVFVTCRVHPGESPCSFTLDGFLDFILRLSDPRAQRLRDRYVFYIVPVLNPDGVVRGFYRADARGVNLNRKYTDPDPKEHPAIYAVKQLFLHLAKQGRVEFFFDLHAHASRRGCFVFGNYNENDHDMINSLLLAKLISLNSAYFDFDQCDFGRGNMSRKDRHNESRSGSSRVALHATAHHPHCYTLECNYHSGKIDNILPRASGGDGRATPPPLPSSTCSSYTPETFADVGKALALALLDYHDENPWSRLPNSEFRSRATLERWIQAVLRAHRADWAKQTSEASAGSGGSGTESTEKTRRRKPPPATRRGRAMPVVKPSPSS